MVNAETKQRDAATEAYFRRLAYRDKVHGRLVEALEVALPLLEDMAQSGNEYEIAAVKLIQKALAEAEKK